jgi:SAM-dependent methyltransferase
MAKTFWKECAINVTALNLGKAGDPGDGLWFSRIASMFGRRTPHIGLPTSACMHCGAGDPEFYKVAIRADFDVSVLPDSIRQVFSERALGICKQCGLVQDYRRFTQQQLHEYCLTLQSKDQSVSEEAFHTFPVPPEYMAAFNARYFSLRTMRWAEYFDVHPVEIKRALFLRPFFGAAPAFIHERFGAECQGLEISAVARKTIETMNEHFSFLDGNIHAYFEGPFLTSGPYDAIFDFHTLVHCIDIHDSLTKLKRLLRPGGAIVFTHEINVKPSNPFHMLFADEAIFLEILGCHFDRVDRIDACEKDPDAHIRNFTVKGDSPDFVAWREMD